MTFSPKISDWRPISGTDKYLVSKDGRVWSKHSGKVLKTKVAKIGYVNIRLSFGLGTRYLHHLVAEAWIGPRPSSTHVVDHIDENPFNNHVDNLEWVTREENTQRASSSGTLSKRRRGRKASLSSEQVYSARSRFPRGESFRSLAREFKVDPTTVRNAVYGIFYGDLLDVPPLKPPERRPALTTPPRTRRALVSEDPPEPHVEGAPGEEWRRLSGENSSYWVSSLGKIYSARSRRLMKPQVTRLGYLRVQLTTKAGLPKNHMVHRLVAKCFLPPPAAPNLIVGHLNEDPSDARAENLKWITRRENAHRSFRWG